ncbi:MAG: hypothetical protein ACHQ53_15250 [Polyangiales bacterium]
MTCMPIAFEITDTGLVRELDAVETARALANIRRWRRETAQPSRWSSLMRLVPDRLILGSALGALFSVTVALCQIAGAI